MDRERDRVFISYSHKDKKFLDELLAHLKPLERAGRVRAWSDKQIQPGSKWLEEIKDALTVTKVAVMLVSKDFLASDFIHEHELGPLLQEADRGGVHILWVLVRACSYKETPLKDYQAVISPDKPLAEMKAERDKAWVRICEEIYKAVGFGAHSQINPLHLVAVPSKALARPRENNPNIKLKLCFDAIDGSCKQQEGPALIPHHLFRVRVNNDNPKTAHKVRVVIEQPPITLPKFQGAELQVRHYEGVSVKDIGIDGKEYFDFLEYNSYDVAVNQPVLHVCHVAKSLGRRVPDADYEFVLKAYSDEGSSNKIRVRFSRTSQQDYHLKQIALNKRPKTPESLELLSSEVTGETRRLKCEGWHNDYSRRLPRSFGTGQPAWVSIQNPETRIPKTANSVTAKVEWINDAKTKRLAVPEADWFVIRTLPDGTNSAGWHTSADIDAGKNQSFVLFTTDDRGKRWIYKNGETPVGILDPGHWTVTLVISSDNFEGFEGTLGFTVSEDHGLQHDSLMPSIQRRVSPRLRQG